MLDGYRSQKAEIMIYTRTPVEGAYPSHLAYSAHFAISRDQRHFQALNRNYGILFASATVGADDTIHEKGLKRPWLFCSAEGKFGIIAIRVNADGSQDEESKGKVLIWSSLDLCRFDEIGLLDLGRDTHVVEVMCLYDRSAQEYHIQWRDAEGNTYQNAIHDLRNAGSMSPARATGSAFCPTTAPGPEGSVNGSITEIDAQLCDLLEQRWTPVHNVAVQVPDTILAPSAADLAAIPAVAVYSDGSTALKRVQWDIGAIDFGKPGIYELRGAVLNERYIFPLASGYADPDILKLGGKYYFAATNDNTNDVGFYVREADTVDGLFAKDAEEHLILGSDETRGFSKCFWAPEFHWIGGSLYILCALGGDGWGPQCYLMRLKEGGRITDPDSWEEPVRVQKADGSWLADDGITLDMTYLKAGGVSYVVWSYRRNIFTSLDSGSMLYIATINDDAPWKLTCKPSLLSRPLFGWENIDHTINNEGPYAIVTNDTVFLTYSGGAAGGYSYALGLLTAKADDDLTKPECWTKSCTPVLSHYSIENEYGPGHNSFFVNARGDLMIAYHAQKTPAGTPRCVGIRRVHFKLGGAPVFDLSPERDLDPKYTVINTNIWVSQRI
jgi:GH43 family beta-xylosidase